MILLWKYIEEKECQWSEVNASVTDRIRLLYIYDINVLQMILL